MNQKPPNLQAGEDVSVNYQRLKHVGLLLGGSNDQK
jgi:hypothetical protein